MKKGSKYETDIKGNWPLNFVHFSFVETKLAWEIRQQSIRKPCAKLCKQMRRDHIKPGKHPEQYFPSAPRWGWRCGEHTQMKYGNPF